MPYGLPTAHCLHKFTVVLEGLTNRSWWDWKNTLGPLKNRPGFTGAWGYQQTNGLGLVEYLEFAEDIGMEIGEFEFVRFQCLLNLTRM